MHNPWLAASDDFRFVIYSSRCYDYTLIYSVAFCILVYYIYCIISRLYCPFVRSNGTLITNSFLSPRKLFLSFAGVF